VELLDKREERIQRMFGQIAPWYDFLNHVLSLNIDKVWRRRTTKLVPPRPASEGAILDLCTGTGDLAFAYAQVAAADVPIYGADFCLPMLEIAGKKKPLNRVKFMQADAQSLPFPDDSFQLVSCAFGLRNITDTDRGIAEMVRVLRPGGKLAILEFSRPQNKLLGPAYTWYFRKVLPRVGQVISRNQESAYKYLPESVLTFPDGEALAEKLRFHGLKEVVFHPFTFGIATLYIGTKG
jgi:demethylmenaquinone methyltransferase / 2-methoxy-6-polyprenyl-1,4-benzoquinol methylase